MNKKARFAVLIGMSCLAMDSTEAQQSISGTEHWVQNGDVRIYVWEKFIGRPENKPIVVLAHGSATAGKESFDLQVKGNDTYSLMDYLAKRGFDVFALDTRGFGRSTHPEGHITSAEASADLNAVVDYAEKMRGVSKVNLLAWSWGTQYGGQFVMAHPEKVNKYVSYAQMHLNSPDLALRRQRIETFRKNPYISIPEAGWKPRFYSMTPESVNNRDAVDAYAKAAAAVEIKTSTGPQLDMVTIMPMVNPRMIKVPVMLIHGQYDDVADMNGLLPFFQELPNPDKRYVVIPDAGHMMMFQKGNHMFQRAVGEFFQSPAESYE